MLVVCTGANLVLGGLTVDIQTMLATRSIGDINVSALLGSLLLSMTSALLFLLGNLESL